MPPIVIAAAIAAAGAIGKGALDSRGATKAARTQADAATTGARLEDEAAQRAETFKREQLQQQYREAEQVRRANYDQWSSRQRSLNAFRQKYGFSPTEIPGYVASQDPGFTGPDAAGPPPAQSPPPAAASWRATPPRDPTRPAPMGAVGAYLPSQRAEGFQSYGVTTPDQALSVGAYVPRRRRVT